MATLFIGLVLMVALAVQIERRQGMVAVRSVMAQVLLQSTSEIQRVGSFETLVTSMKSHQESSTVLHLSKLRLKRGKASSKDVIRQRSLPYISSLGPIHTIALII